LLKTALSVYSLLVVVLSNQISDQLKIMGVINTTPDSFSDGGQLTTLSAALNQAKAFIAEGVDILDIGGESTRPGSQCVDTPEEIRRTIPLIEAIRKFSDTPISIDTNKSIVMREAVGAGADIVNSIWALRLDDSLQTAADLGVTVCLMHMQGNPETMQINPKYTDVVSEVLKFLEERINAANDAGIPKSQIIVDPGFGFGKTLEHNLQILKSLSSLKALGVTVLAGLSRKGMIGTMTGRDVTQRLAGSLTTSVIAAMSGADIIRVHDVAETVDAVKIIRKLNETNLSGA
jgi:dihydropteroate synthase